VARAEVHTEAGRRSEKPRRKSSSIQATKLRAQRANPGTADAGAPNRTDAAGATAGAEFTTETPPMIAHIVLFRPRPHLTNEERRDLMGTLTRALRDIPSIRRASVGSRIRHGRPYESLMQTDYTYAAILEFDDLAGLKAYLEHPSHDALGSQFFAVFEEALMYDFEMEEGSDGVSALWKTIEG
jgi:hypothetical protein